MLSAPLLREKRKGRFVLSARRKGASPDLPRAGTSSCCVALIPARAMLLISPCKPWKGLEWAGKLRSGGTRCVGTGCSQSYAENRADVGENLRFQKASFTFLLLHEVVTVEQLYPTLQERRRILTLF